MSGFEIMFGASPEEIKMIMDSTKELEKAVELFQKRQPETETEKTDK